jgi:16S rRNA (adenine1518-N6/adenine1519-N6)-dimethyltransferase
MSSEATRLFRQRGLLPKKSFGQNFLADRSIAQRIADLATTPEGGTVLEIGAGLGALTEPLVARASRVVAVERDRDLCPILREVMAGAIDEGRLVVLESDAKRIDLAAILGEGPRPRTLAGNLPYQLTGPLLEAATHASAALDRAVFMVQAEVADRLLAAPGSGDYGALTVFVSAAFRVERAMRVSRGAFFPQPGVDSAVITLAPHAPPRAVETDRFRAAVRAAFAQRRKTLRNAWSKLDAEETLAARAREAGIDLNRRGETLSVEEFARFAAARGQL